MTTYITPDGSPTIGPADPNAGGRAKLYAGLAVLTPLLGALATFGVITSDQGNAITGFITATMGLLGVFGFGLAASKTNKQVKDGTFEPAPPNPVANAFDALSQIKEQVDATVNTVQGQVGQAVDVITGAVSMLPGGSALTTAVMSGEVGDLIQAMSDRPVARRDDG